MASNDPKGEGVLFTNRDKTTDKHPHFKGYVTLTREQLNALLADGKAGREPKLQIAAWPRKAKESGAPYIFLSTEVWTEQRGQQNQWPEQQPQQQPRPQRQQSNNDGWPDDIPF